MGLTFKGVHPSFAVMEISGGVATVTTVCAVADPHELFIVNVTTYVPAVLKLKLG
jgi:hypothetical protein